MPLSALRRPKAAWRRTGNARGSSSHCAHWRHASRRCQFRSRWDHLCFTCPKWNRIRQPQCADRRLSRSTHRRSHVARNADWARPGVPYGSHWRVDDHRILEGPACPCTSRELQLSLGNPCRPICTMGRNGPISKLVGLAFAQAGRRRRIRGHSRQHTRRIHYRTWCRLHR